MAFVCSISGYITEEPVVSKLGYIFERRLIEKHIDTIGICPITGNQITRDDLIPLKIATITKPRTPNATDIPSLINLFKSEFDSIMCEMFNVKKELEYTRQQLTIALYKYDAATRVITRLMRESKETRMITEAAERQFMNIEIMKDITQTDYTGISTTMIEDMIETSKKLLEERRKRVISNIDVNKIQNCECKRIFDLHSVIRPGVNCVTVHPRTRNLSTPVIISAGNDSIGTLFDTNSDKVNRMIKKNRLYAA